MTYPVGKRSENCLQMTSRTGAAAWSLRGGRASHYSLMDVLWLGLLLLVSIVLAYATARAFSPGGYNSDILFQLDQALGRTPYNDWHPVVQAVLWKGLIALTGEISSMAYLQIFLMWIFSFGLGVYVYDLSRSRVLSAMGALLPALPWVLSQVGMLWKDTQMMIALFGAVVLILLAERFPRLKLILLVIAGLFLVYGVMVRKNAIFAVVPLLWLLYFTYVRDPEHQRGSGDVPEGSWNRKREGRLTWKRMALQFSALLLVFGSVTSGASALVNAATDPVEGNQLTQVMLDDVLFTMSKKDIEAAAIPEELRESLLAAQRECPPDELGTISDAYWRCYGLGADGGYTAIAHDTEVRELWRDHVLTNPLGYLEYRTQVYTRFLFATDYKFQSNIRHNDLGLERENIQTFSILADYVDTFAIQKFPWVFDTWFWALVTVLVLLNWRRYRELRVPILSFGISSLVYLVGYFPIVPAFNYRYTLWSAAVMSVALVLVLVDRRLTTLRSQRPVGNTSVSAEVADAPVHLTKFR